MNKQTLSQAKARVDAAERLQREIEATDQSVAIFSKCPDAVLTVDLVTPPKTDGGLASSDRVPLLAWLDTEQSDGTKAFRARLRELVVQALKDHGSDLRRAFKEL